MRTKKQDLQENNIPRRTSKSINIPIDINTEYLTWGADKNCTHLYPDIYQLIQGKEQKNGTMFHCYTYEGAIILYSIYKNASIYYDSGDEDDKESLYKVVVPTYLLKSWDKEVDDEKQK